MQKQTLPKRNKTKALKPTKSGRKRKRSKHSDSLKIELSFQVLLLIFFLVFFFMVFQTNSDIEEVLVASTFKSHSRHSPSRIKQATN
jgi:hypothetical protein